MTFDPHQELETVRNRRRTIRRRRRYRRKLDRFRAEIVALRQAVATIRDIVDWLCEHNCKVAGSTVWRYLRSLPEMKEG